MAVRKQVCVICGAENPLEERSCAICGARLTGRLSETKPSNEANPAPKPSGFYDFTLGEDDLMASSFGGGLWLAVALLLSGVAVAGVLLYTAVGSPLQADEPIQVAQQPSDTLTPDLTQTQLGLTPQPSLTPSLTRTSPPPLPTVTLTLTPVPTLGPCEFTVQEGNTLYDLALQCGHRDYGIIGEIVALNELPSEISIQIGQVIQVPRPTPTIDPAAITDPSAGALPAVGNDSNSDGQISAEEIIASRAESIEPTLDPNLQYHTVQVNQTLIDIVAIYNIDVKLLSEINPEIEFPQCDFGMQFGGPTCAVILYEGQRLRVPAPTPTPTIPPTASGSETPTPSPTATINVPQAIAPENGSNFDAASVVTLRWSTTGTLGQDEVYVVHMRNLKSEQESLGITCDLAFDVPAMWQARQTNEFIEFEWWVTIADVSPFGTGQDNFGTRFSGLSLCKLSFDPPINWEANPSNILDVGIITDLRAGDERFPTVPRRFYWQGREE